MRRSPHTTTKTRAAQTAPRETMELVPVASLDEALEFLESLTPF